MGSEPRGGYDNETIVRKLMRRDGMNLESALEFFEYNILEACVGESAPLFLAALG